MSGNSMEYKGYSASIQYSAEDGCLVGQVVGINDILVFHGDSTGEIQENFHNVLDNYLEACRQTGKTPEQPKSGKILLRLPAALHAYVASQSELAGQSVNQLVVDVLRAAFFGETVESKPSGKRRRARRNVVVK